MTGAFGLVGYYFGTLALPMPVSWLLRFSAEQLATFLFFFQ